MLNKELKGEAKPIRKEKVAIIKTNKAKNRGEVKNSVANAEKRIKKVKLLVKYPKNKRQSCCS